MAHPRYDSDSHGSDGIIGLVRETADGLSQLIADHIKLARTEIAADARVYARQSAVLAVAGFVLALGYALACVAASLALARYLGTALAFICVGGLHILAGAIAVGVALRRMRRTRLLGESVAEMGRSVSALSPAMTSGNGFERTNDQPGLPPDGLPGGRRLV
jgi:hypothetical protein